MGIPRVLLCVTAMWFVSSTEAADMCVACTYSRSGDWTTDYKCVNDSYHQANSRNISCNFATHSCVIWTQYQYPGFQQVQSVERSCMSLTTRSQVCDPSDGRLCVLECKTSFCNALQNADLAKVYAASSVGASSTRLLLAICLSALASIL